ncbi:MAG: hypothetical protein IIX47_00905 [Spirochaetaceae bacterium]|nr:hypothetical protein [Spirochaetaceae bacterium]
MMYNYMTLNDGTGIAHSEVILNNNQETVKVYFEQPIENGFNCAECWLSSYNWTLKEGFSEEQLNYLQEFLESTAHIIILLARCGGFDNASGF